MKKTVLSVLLILGFTVLLAQTSEKKEIKTSAECEMCKEAIELAVNDLSGIDSCDLDIPSRVLTVYYHPDDLELGTIYKAINMAGYDADSTKADKRGLRNLPDCCKPGGMEKK